MQRRKRGYIFTTITYPFIYLPPYLPACLPLPACPLPTPTYLPAYPCLPTPYLPPTYLPAYPCLPTPYLPACLSLPTYPLPTCLPTLPTHLPTPLPSKWSKVGSTLPTGMHSYLIHYWFFITINERKVDCPVIYVGTIHRNCNTKMTYICKH